MSKKQINTITNIVIFLFAIFIAYQILRVIFGGSWQFESIIIAILVFNLGITWKINTKLEGHMGWHKGRESKL